MLDVEKGPTAVFQSEVIGTAPFGVNWFNDMKPLPLDKRHALVFQDSVAHMKLHSFERSDLEEYHYCLSNTAGKMSSELISGSRGQYVRERAVSAGFPRTNKSVATNLQRGPEFQAIIC